MGRLGIDLSGDALILASVSPTADRLQLRDFERLESTGDVFELASELRRARHQHRFPRRAEVVAWPGDPRVNAVRQAGFTVERVITPGEALERVARMHHGLSGIPGVTAVLSVDATGGALAIVRDNHILQETALTWSARGASDAADSNLLRRYAFLSELTETLGASFAAVLRNQNAKVHEILTCGSLPDLRSLTMPLADEFDVEVETLDSLSNIDVRVRGRMPEEMADALPTLWIAMVASRRWHPRRRKPVRRLLKIAVPVGLAAGFALMMFAGEERGGAIGSKGSKGSIGSKGSTGSKGPTGSVGSMGSKGPVPPVASTATPGVMPRAPAEPSASAPRESQLPATQPPAVVRREDPRPVPPPAALTPSQPDPRPAPPRTAETRVEPPRTATATAVRPAADVPPRVATPLSPPREPAAPQVREVPVRPSEPRITERPARPTPESTQGNLSNFSNLSTLPRITLPLTSILWSTERQLVVAEGQMLEVGDTIAGMRIVRIEQDGVIVRDRSGRLRRAALRSGPGSM